MSGPNAAPIVGAAVALLGTDHLALTDSAGRFRIDSVPAGTYSAQAGAPGFDVVRLDGVVVSAGSISAIGIALTPTPPPQGGTGSVVGSAKLSDAANPAGTLVQLEGTNFSAVTGSNGSFLLAGVVPGQYTLLVQHSGYAQQTVGPVTVSADAQADVGLVTLTPTPGGAGY